MQGIKIMMKFMNHYYGQKMITRLLAGAVESCYIYYKIVFTQLALLAITADINLESYVKDKLRLW
jgi:hypothetical protein